MGKPTVGLAPGPQFLTRKLFAIGAETSIGGRHLATVEEYDPALLNWTKEKDMLISDAVCPATLL